MKLITTDEFCGLLLFVVRIMTAIYAGSCVQISLIEHPTKYMMPVDLALGTWRTTFRRYVRISYMNAISSFIMLFLWLLTGYEFWLTTALLSGIAMPWTIFIIRPTSRQLLSPTITEGAAKYNIRKWGVLHWMRTILSLIVLAIVSVAEHLAED